MAWVDKPRSMNIADRRRSRSCQYSNEWNEINVSTGKGYAIEITPNTNHWESAELNKCNYVFRRENLQSINGAQRAFSTAVRYTHSANETHLNEHLFDAQSRRIQSNCGVPCTLNGPPFNQKQFYSRKLNTQHHHLFDIVILPFAGCKLLRIH